jgi:hypothetical protein
LQVFYRNVLINLVNCLVCWTQFNHLRTTCRC